MFPFARSTALDNLDPIEQKALDLAGRSDDPDSMLKAVQILNIIADQRQKTAGLEQASLEHKKAGRALEITQIWAKILTPVLPFIAIIVTVVTLGVQMRQASTASEAQRKASEDTQWHETMKSVTLQPPSAALVGAFNMESFLDTARYHDQARSILSALLPQVEDSSGFDVVFFNLHRSTDGDNQIQLISIARVVAAKDLDNFKIANRRGKKNFRDFVGDPTAFFEDEPDSPNLSSALARSWEIDSISHGLSGLWRPGSGHVSAPASDLSGIILESEFEQVDFSSTNLSSTSFWGANVKNANFSAVTKFDKSEWQDTNWWQASMMCCDLARYLRDRYLPTGNEDATLAKKFAETSCSGTDASTRTTVK
jgi:hypothetical protein